MAPQTLAHKRRIAAALKKYHACAKKHGCGKGTTTKKKRPVGRPRKTVTAKKRPVGRPRKRITNVTARPRPVGARRRALMPQAIGYPLVERLQPKKRGRPLGSKNKPRV